MGVKTSKINDFAINVGGNDWLICKDKNRTDCPSKISVFYKKDSVSSGTIFVISNCSARENKGSCLAGLINTSHRTGQSCFWLSKVVATVKYINLPVTTVNPNPKTLTELSFIHNNYLGTGAILTDMQASTTQLIQRDIWGSILSNSFDSTKQIPTSYGYTGHKYDEQSELTYAHARSLNTGTKMWLSQDDISINGFSSDALLLNPQMQNSYSYSTNDPVNKVDPDGRLTIIVPGTCYGNDWTPAADKQGINARVENTFGEKPQIIYDTFNWTGGNMPSDRTMAAQYLAAIINNYEFKKGEKLNIVTHSHGGNVAKEAIGLLKEGIVVDNFVALGAPIRADYKTDMSRVKNMIEVYSEKDSVQANGGGKYVLNNVLGYYLNKGRTNFEFKFKGYFEYGPAGRYENEKNSINVSNLTSKSLTGTKAHGELWTVTNVWQLVDNKINGK